MPRAQRTKSAVHEALQRRAGKRPGDSFSGLLGGGWEIVLQNILEASASCTRTARNE
jgi:hypothetical protein